MTIWPIKLSLLMCFHLAANVPKLVGLEWRTTASDRHTVIRSIYIYINYFFKLLPSFNGQINE